MGGWGLERGRVFCHELGVGMKVGELSSRLLFYSFTQGETRGLEWNGSACVRACVQNEWQTTKHHLTYIHQIRPAALLRNEEKQGRNEKKQVVAWRFLIKKSHLYSFTCLRYPPAVATTHCVIVLVQSGIRDVRACCTDRSMTHRTFT